MKRANIILLLCTLAGSIFLAIFLTSCAKEKTTEEVLIWIPGDEQEYGFYFDMFETYKQHLESQGKTFIYTIEQQPWGDYWTKLPLEVNNGRGPDLFLSHVAYVDLLIPIAKALSLNDDVLRKFEIADLYVDENGKPVFIPTVFVSKIMYVNTDIVKDWQDIPTTWDELAQKAKQHTAIEQGIIGFDYPFHILWDLAYQNNEYLTEQGKPIFTSTGLDTVVRWTNEGFVDYLQFGNGSPEESLYEGSAAYIYGEPWMEFWASDEVKQRIKAFPVPGSRTHNSAELSFGINKNVSDEKYTLLNDFIEFMLTDPKTITSIVQGNSGAPNNKEVQVSYTPFSAGDAVMATFKKGASQLVVPPRALEQVYNTMLENALNNVPIQQVINEAYANVDGVNVSRLVQMESIFR